mmetsp:Transcript_10992/g.22739  ORF Transcript_10992/g.22739 Transcript_10992/m.22739 type:complete len:141 (-) Transcript_10992:253-675(-)
MDQLRSKGLLPAIGVGGAVYIVTGVVSLGTLALVGAGAGVGYGIGSWLVDQYEKKQQKQGGGAPLEQLPPQFQASLMQWQAYLGSRTGGCQPTPAQVQQIFLEFEQLEPGHAQNVRSMQQAVDSGGATGGVRVVAQAAEV